MSSLKSKKTMIIVAMCLGVFITLLDTTVMNIALANIQENLNTNFTALNWALNIYSLLFATFAIPLGKLSGRFGLNKSFLVGILLFLIGSIVSGIANNVEVLILGRIIQSLGAAIVLPLAMAIAYSTVTVEERKTIVAAIAMTQGLAGALGPSIGGALTTYLSWRWVFFVNIPIIIIILFLSFSSLELRKEKINHEKTDIIGSLFCMLMLVTLTLALIQGNEWGWSSIIIVSLFLLSFISLISFIWYENKIEYPMIPLGLFKNRQFNGAALTMVLSTVFFVGVFIILPTYFVKVQHQTALAASILLTIISITLSFFSPLASLLVTKIGARLTIFSGFILMGISYLLLSILGTDSMLLIYGACIFLGAGYGLLLGPVQVLGASNFEGSLLTSSQSVLFVLRQVGLVLAFAIFISVLNGNMKMIGTIYTPIAAFTSIYKISLFFVFLSSIVSLLFKKNDIILKKEDYKMSYSIAFSQATEIMIYISIKLQENQLKYLTIQSISEKLNIPIPSVKRIIGLLKNEGLIISKAGISGGLMLKKNLEEITLYDIFIAIEGGKPLFKVHKEFEIEKFEHVEQVKLQLNRINDSLCEAENEMINVLKKKKIKDIIEI